MSESTLKPLSTDVVWENFRQQMTCSKKWAYFDHAAVSPLPESTKLAIHQWLDGATDEGDFVWPSWANRMEELRSLAAKMINSAPSEIGLIPNTTTGIGWVADGIDWKEGDNVVIPGGEFPSNVYPWLNLRNLGVEVRIVECEGKVVDLNKLSAACDDRTRVLSCSWIGYASGYRIDPKEVAEIAHRHGALFFLDAIQGLGIFPLDVEDAQVDFLAADGHKWMLGPEGAGLFYVRKEVLNQLRPACVGWNSVKDRYNFSKIDLELRDETARYEGGSQNMIGFHGLAASLELLIKSGHGPNHSAVGDRILEMSQYLVEQLNSVGAKIFRPGEAANRSGIVAFDPLNGTPEIARQKLIDQHVLLSCRGGHLRAAVHAYNNTEDIDRLISVLKTI